jgi:Na+-transporting NADH:ubiquinone oxidoreductase subunit NqrF
MNNVNVLTLVKKDGERYVFMYKSEYRPDILRTLGRFASDKDLSFSWYDAAVLSQKVRQEAYKEQQQEQEINQDWQNDTKRFGDKDFQTATGFDCM